MSFPADPLGIRIRIALDGPDRSTDPSGWTWEDITDYGREAQQIVVAQGDADEFGDTPPATCAVTLDNTDGRFTRRNPLGAYYGRLGRNTPIWIEVDPGTGYETRFRGEVNAWPKRWDRSGNDVTVPISCAGISRRLGQNDAEVTSALSGYLPSTAPIAWWPLEDGEDAAYAKSGLIGGQPAVVRRGLLDFTTDAPPGASGSAHPDPSASNALVGTIVGASDTGFQVSVWTKGVVADDDTSDPAASGYYIPWEVRTTNGQIFRLIMQWDEDTAITVAHYNAETQTSPVNFIELADNVTPHTNPGITGEWIHCQFMARPAGANVDVFLWVNGTLVDSGTWNSLTLGAPVRVNAIGGFVGTIGTISLNLRDIWISQLAVHDFAHFQVVQYDAGLGFPGETAADRILRLCVEQDVPCSVQGSADTEPMGPQTLSALMPLLRQCETVDGGTLQDDPTSPGLLYIPRVERYNMPFTLDLDYNDGDVGAEPEATDDDRDVVNRVVMTRTGGTTVTVQDDDDIAAGGGVVITDSQTRNVWLDSQLPDQAGWRLRQGTVDVDRWPKITLNLSRRPELIADWCSVVPGGSRARIVNFPDQIGPDPIDVVIEGYTETIGTYQWVVDMFCSPAAPWTVGVAEDDVLGRADTDGSRFVPALVSGTTTSALVVVTAGPPWITTANQSAMFPFDIRSGGVVLSTTGITNAATDSFTRSASNGWGTSTTGQAWSVNSGTASEFSVTSNQGRQAMVSTNDLHVISIDVGSPDADPTTEVVIPVVPTGAGFTVRSIARMTTVADYYYAELTFGLLGVVTLRLFKRVSNTATQLGSSVVLPGTHAGGDRWVVQSSAIGDTIRARGWKSTSLPELGWHINATDTALTTGDRVGLAARRETSNSNGSQSVDFDNFAVPGLQTFTISSTPVNGVIRTIPAGEAVSLANPWRAAL